MRNWSPLLMRISFLFFVLSDLFSWSTRGASTRCCTWTRSNCARCTPASTCVVSSTTSLAAKRRRSPKCVPKDWIPISTVRNLVVSAAGRWPFVLFISPTGSNWPKEKKIQGRIEWKAWLGTDSPRRCRSIPIFFPLFPLTLRDSIASWTVGNDGKVSFVLCKLGLSSEFSSPKNPTNDPSVCVISR